MIYTHVLNRAGRLFAENLTLTKLGYLTDIANG